MKRSFDAAKIRAVLDHPDIKPNISDTDTPYELPMTDDHHYLLGNGSLFIYHPYDKDTLQVHVNIIKEQRFQAYELGLEAIEYAKTIGKNFVTFVPYQFPNVRDYTLKLGLDMTDTGTQWRFDKRFI